MVMFPIPIASPPAFKDARRSMIVVASKEELKVSCAISEREACMDFAMTFRICGSFTSV